MKKFILISMSVLFFMGCSTVTISPQGKAKLATNPTYESSKSFFLGGLVGEEDFDITKPCNSKMPIQVQTQTTFVDSLLTLVTIGIYAPRTVRVWCGG